MSEPTPVPPFEVHTSAQIGGRGGLRKVWFVVDGTGRKVSEEFGSQRAAYDALPALAAQHGGTPS